MRIAQVTPYFYPVEGGVERHVYNLSKCLVERGHDVHVFTYIGDRKERKLDEEAYFDGIKVSRYKAIVRIGEFARLWPGVIKELIRGDFDVIHTHVYRHPHSDIALFSSKVSGSKSIMTAHSPFPPPKLRSNFTKLFVPFYDGTLARLTLSRYDAIVCLTNYEARKLVSLGALPSKVVIIPHGVDSIHFEKVQCQEFLEKFGLMHKRFILYLGRINRSKGLEYLLQAFSAVYAKHRDLTLVIAGPTTDDKEEEYRDQLLQYVYKNGLNGKVLFTGALSEKEKMAAYQSCYAFVLPSVYEPYGMVLLEAAAHGKPLISTSTDGPASIIIDGLNGFLVRPEDPLQLAESINTLVEDERLASKMGIEARAIASKYTWQEVTDRIERVYRGRGS